MFPKERTEINPVKQRGKHTDMGGCQNYGPFLGILNIRSQIIIGIQKGTISLTTTHMLRQHSRKQTSVGVPRRPAAGMGFRVYRVYALEPSHCENIWIYP